ncbi:hypothetical protein [Dokdonella sp.]|uniref:hypothetical protein n=1 Tax=Dokdonella sp. TaxID=2291710 RepID=UPI00378325D3
MPTSARSTHAFAGFALALAAAFIAIPAWQLIGPGPFDWHIRQPEFVQGGLEALALIALVAGAFTLRSSGAAVLLATAALALFLRRHAVDAPLLIDLLYFEIVIGLGMLVRRVCGLSDARDTAAYLQAFVLGFIAWSLIAWTASAFGVGSIRELRAITLALGATTLLARTPPLLVFLWRSLRAQDRLARAWGGALAAWLAVLYARTNVVHGYDSLWYGLRGEYVLAPGHSVFDALGLVSPVHYFPKLYEVFLLPVSALGDSSVISGMSIWVLLLILAVCARIADTIGIDARDRLPVLAAIATLPALAATALEPKPDVISTLFALIAVDGALAFARTRQWADWCWIAAAAALACMAKLTAIPFMGVLVLGSLLQAWRPQRHAPDQDAAVNKDVAVWALAGALAVAVFVTARTWLLTGMPTIGPDVLFKLWSSLGMQLRDPVGTLQWTWPQNWASLPGVFVDWLLRPQTMPHIVIGWMGNVWLWLAVLGMGAGLLGQGTAKGARTIWPLAAMAVTAFVLATAIGYRERGGDGNYFLIGLLPGVLLAANSAFARGKDSVRLVLMVCLSAFVLFQAAYGFASAGWAPGTRSFDLVMTRNWHDDRRLRWTMLASAGIEKIGRHLKEHAHAHARAVGYATEPASLWLPTQFENLLTISFARPEFVETEAGFTSFMRDQDIDFLVLPQPAIAAKEYAWMPAAVGAVARQLEREPGVIRVDDRDYYLLDLSGRARD